MQTPSPPITIPDVGFAGYKFRCEGQYGPFRAGALAGITLGARMPQANIDELVKIATQHAPVLPVWRERETEPEKFDFERIA